MGRTPIPEMLTPAELGERLRIGRNATYALLRAPGFPAVRVGGQIRIPVGALAAWMARQWEPGGGRVHSARR